MDISCIAVSLVVQASNDNLESQEGKVVYQAHYDYDALYDLLSMDSKKYDEYWNKGFSIAEMLKNKVFQGEI